MAAAFAEVAIAGAGDLCLLPGGGFDNDVGLGHGFVKTAACDRTFVAINDNGGPSTSKIPRPTRSRPCSRSAPARRLTEAVAQSPQERTAAWREARFAVR